MLPSQISVVFDMSNPMQVGGLLPGGLSVRGLSGGERRRLNISCGIVAAPSIIFLDEPTSGIPHHIVMLQSCCQVFSKCQFAVRSNRESLTMAQRVLRDLISSMKLWCGFCYS